MTGKPRGFSQAIDELESQDHAHSGNGHDVRSRLERELHRMEEVLEKIKPHIDDLGGKAADEARKAKDKVETQVKENPWAALGIVGLVFLVLGFLLGFTTSRRSD